MRILFFLVFAFGINLLFSQDLNGDLIGADMYKADNYFYVYGFKDKKTFKVIKYDTYLKIVKEYEKQLPDEVSVALGFYQYKFLDVRNKLEFNIFHNLKKTRGVWIKLDYDLKETDFTTYGESEAKSAIENKTNEAKEKHTPLIYVDIINGYYDDATFQDQLKKNTCLYQDGEYLYVFQQGDKDITWKFEKGLFNKENCAVRKYKIKSDKGFPVMSQEWEMISDDPFMLPAQVIPSLSTKTQLTFLRNYREIVTLDKQTGTVIKRKKFDLGHNKEGEDFISNVYSKYIPEKEIFAVCGLITHENKGIKKVLTTDYENKKYFIYVFDKDGKEKNKYEEVLPEYDVKKSGTADLKYKGMDFLPNGITCDGTRLVIYAVNTTGGVQATEGADNKNNFSGPNSFGNSNNNSIGFSSYSLCNIMIGISVHILDLEDYSYKYSFILDKSFNESKYIYQQEIKFSDITKTESGSALIILEEANHLDADLLWKKVLKINFGSTGTFTELKIKSKYSYFVGDINKVYLFDKKGNDGKYKITILPQ